MKRVLIAYVAGALSVLGCAYYLGAEFLVETGLRLSAAQAHYDWTAVPREATPVSYATRDLVLADEPAMRPAKKGRR